MSNPFVILLTGLIPMIVFLAFIGIRKIRNTRVCIILLFIAICYTVLGVVIRNEAYQLPNINAADFFYAPLAHLISYLLLRRIYLKVYHFEPTYYRTAWYDPHEGREQNWFDIFVYIIPIYIALLIPLFLNAII